MTFYREYVIPDGTECKFPAGTYKYSWTLNDDSQDQVTAMFATGKCAHDISIKDLTEFDTTFAKYADVKREHEAYMYTFVYKGISAPVFYDDYGQCFYAIVNGKEVSFGTYNDAYEDELKWLIDDMQAKV